MEIEAEHTPEIETKHIPIPKPEIEKVDDLPIVLSPCHDCNTCRPDVYE